MDKLYIPARNLSPEISFNPDTWELSFSGNSAPEDVRTLYYPILEWAQSLTEKVLANPSITGNKGMTLTINLKYFNSSSAKFLHDIITELARLKFAGCSLEVRWVFEREDTDMEEAGLDMSILVGFDFIFIPK